MIFKQAYDDNEEFDEDAIDSNNKMTEEEKQKILSDFHNWPDDQENDPSESDHSESEEEDVDSVKNGGLSTLDNQSSDEKEDSDGLDDKRRSEKLLRIAMKNQSKSIISEPLSSTKSESESEDQSDTLSHNDTEININEDSDDDDKVSNRSKDTKLSKEFSSITKSQIIVKRYGKPDKRLLDNSDHNKKTDENLVDHAVQETESNFSNRANELSLTKNIPRPIETRDTQYDNEVNEDDGRLDHHITKTSRPKSSDYRRMVEQEERLARNEKVISNQI